jgi:hypothetical protein
MCCWDQHIKSLICVTTVKINLQGYSSHVKRYVCIHATVATWCSHSATCYTYSLSLGCTPSDVHYCSTSVIHNVHAVIVYSYCFEWVSTCDTYAQCCCMDTSTTLYRQCLGRNTCSVLTVWKSATRLVSRM